MSRTTKLVICLLLAVPITLAICGLAMAGKPPANHAPVLNASMSPVLAPESQNVGAPSARWARWWRPSSTSLSPLDK